MILRVKKRGDGRPLKRGKGPLVKGAPGSLLGGRLGAVAPPASFNVQEVPADPERVATPLRVRVMGGGGDGLRGVWLVGGGWGWGGGGR